MNQFIRQISTLFLLTCLPFSATFAGEGMWLPQLLNSLNEGEMQSMGLKLSAEDIYSVNKGSLKDAIVHFGGFCTSELISPNGLLLTNHHCGYGAIQEHTTLKDNYLRDGFWAKNFADEKPNDGLTATFIVRIEDVTKQALMNVGDDLATSERQSLIDKNINQIKKLAKLGEHEELVIKPFFKGNQYFMFVTMTYKDVRLVGAPPSSIGKYGADTDNWVWPRHTGDFSLFRIYADANNMPAEYSKDNKPYTPKHYLPIAMDGVEEGDFTMVFGFPGRTNEYLPSYAIEQLMNVTDPARIAVRDKALKIVDSHMRADEQIKIMYASKFASIANYWKKWIGEKLGLEKTNAVKRKTDYEAEFVKRLGQNKRKYPANYKDILEQFKTLYAEIEPLERAHAYHGEITGRNIELIRFAGLMRNLVKRHSKGGDKAYEAYKKRLEPYLKDLYKNYSAKVDRGVFTALMDMYATEIDKKYVAPYFREMHAEYDLAETVFDKSMFTDEAKVMRLFAETPEKAIAAIKEDPAFRLADVLLSFHDAKVGEPYNRLKTQIDDLMRTYMKAQMDVFQDRKFYPDANSTLRLTYGKVAGYTPRDAVNYDNTTYLDGIIEKYVPGDYEFDLPQKLIDLYEAKDYGQYADKNGKVPVCFIGTNHTTGGNSGSPAIDAHGNLIGLNFDRAWEGTMSDVNYDPSICRNIMVDIRYVLFIVDKYAGATHLIDEMKLVHPKR